MKTLEDLQDELAILKEVKKNRQNDIAKKGALRDVKRAIAKETKEIADLDKILADD